MLINMDQLTPGLLRSLRATIKEIMAFEFEEKKRLNKLKEEKKREELKNKKANKHSIFDDLCYAFDIDFGECENILLVEFGIIDLIKEYYNKIKEEIEKIPEDKFEKSKGRACVTRQIFESQSPEESESEN